MDLLSRRQMKIGTQGGGQFGISRLDETVSWPVPKQEFSIRERMLSDVFCTRPFDDGQVTGGSWRGPRLSQVFTHCPKSADWNLRPRPLINRRPSRPEPPHPDSDASNGTPRRPGKPSPKPGSPFP